MTDHRRSGNGVRTTDQPARRAAPAGASGLDDPRVERAMEEYLRLLQAGQRPDRAAFLARYPDVAAALATCLQGLDFVHAAGGELSHLAAHGSRPADVGAHDAVEPPEALGDFRIVREVGRGGMGVVYEAVQVSLGRRVALKVLPFAATMDPRQLQRFLNEARAAASLDHPHIVHVHAVGCERAVHFYAMQYIEGQTLAAVIAEMRSAGGRPGGPAAEPTTPLPSPEAPSAAADTLPRAAASTERAPRDRAYYRRVAEWGAQAAEALDHAHALGIVHRDVKPANLLVDGRGGLWVTDFGLAHVQSDARLTMTGDLVGTLRYMSPEQALAQRVVIDHRTDVYSLGATLYELLTLEPAFSGADRQELLRQIAFEEPKPPRRLNRSVPAELETIVLKAVEKNSAERYATAQELAEDLRRYLADEPIRARPAGVVRRLRKWGRRHRAAVTAAVLALLVVLAVVAGTAGWVQGDRRARREADERQVAEALAVLRPGLEAGNPHAADVVRAAQQVEAHLASGLVGPELRAQSESLLADLEMLARLEQIRLDAAAVKDGHFDSTVLDPAYAAAFREYGIDVEAPEIAKVAARVRGSSIREALVAALDDWIAHRPVDQCTRLRAVVDQADDNSWRQGFRAAARHNDLKQLQTLAGQVEVRTQPPAVVILLGDTLGAAGLRERAAAILAQAQQSHPADFWLNHDLAKALAEFQPPRLDDAIGYYRAALALRPESPGVRLNLGNPLRDKGRLDEAIAELREAIRLKKDYAGAHSNLGVALHDKGRLDEAIAEYREAIRLKKDFHEARNNLGAALRAKARLDEAIAEYREAIRLKKDYPEAHQGLGLALYDKGRLDDAIAEFREAIRLKKDYPGAHYSLGLTLHHKGRLDEAIAEYRAAIRLKKDYAEAHYNLGGALLAKGRLDEAIAEYRAAIEVQPEDAKAYTNLGGALLGKGRLDEAMAALQKAIELKPDDAEAHCNLGMVLQGQGRFRAAVVELRHGHELGRKAPAWPYPSAAWVEKAERLAKLEPKLPALLKGEVKPAGAAESLALAQICQTADKQLNAAAARWYAEAFAAEPRLADDLSSENRYSAACAAALAGCGRGKDAAGLDAKKRARLRRQALDWQRADLAAWGRLVEKKPDQARPLVTATLRHWLEDPDFAGVRGPSALAKLPDAERPAWQKLWADVADMLARSQGKTMPAKTTAAK
jgi:serine/threonine protein kinase/Flp pilus assembly protein TadD